MGFRRSIAGFSKPSHLADKRAKKSAFQLGENTFVDEIRGAFTAQFLRKLASATLLLAVQLLAPDGMLGRAASLITVFAQTTNGLGALLAGIAAQYMGASNALLVGSGLCFLMILGICIAIPQLWHYRS